MSLRVTFAAGAIFAACVWCRVFGLVPVKSILVDPNGDNAAIQVQIEAIQRFELDSSAINR